VNTLAQIAARAAFARSGARACEREMNSPPGLRDPVRRAFADLGLPHPPSVGNFLLIDLSTGRARPGTSPCCRKASS
jgi:histidinol-phosphate/aromatic aminotransferase/cobyric acid decarboxylase-like protein